MTLFGPATISRLQDVLSADGQCVDRLVEIAGLDPRRDLRFADLQGVDFSGSTLIGWDLTGADLQGAKFVGARLSNCVFTGAVGLDLAGSIDVADDTSGVQGKVAYLGAPGG